MDNNGAFIIGWDFSEDNEHKVLIVMQGGNLQHPAKIINAFYGEEALWMYGQLTRKKDDKYNTDAAKC